MSDHVIVTYDTHGSNLAIISPASNSYNTTGSVTLQWNAVNTVSGIAKTETSTDGTTWTTATGTSHVLTLGDGPYTAYVKVTDNAGNVNQTSVSFTVDTVKPVVVYQLPGQRNDQHQRLGAGPMERQRCHLGDRQDRDQHRRDQLDDRDRQQHRADPCRWHLHRTVKVTDKAGNINQTSISFIVNMIKPVVAIVYPTSNSYNNTGSVKSSGAPRWPCRTSPRPRSAPMGRLDDRDRDQSRIDPGRRKIHGTPQGDRQGQPCQPDLGQLHRRHGETGGRDQAPRSTERPTPTALCRSSGTPPMPHRGSPRPRSAPTERLDDRDREQHRP